ISSAGGPDVAADHDERPYGRPGEELGTTNCPPAPRDSVGSDRRRWRNRVSRPIRDCARLAATIGCLPYAVTSLVAAPACAWAGFSLTQTARSTSRKRRASSGATKGGTQK